MGKGRRGGEEDERGKGREGREGRGEERRGEERRGNTGSEHEIKEGNSGESAAFQWQQKGRSVRHDLRAWPV